MTKFILTALISPLTVPAFARDINDLSIRRVGSVVRKGTYLGSLEEPTPLKWMSTKSPTSTERFDHERQCPLPRFTCNCEQELKPAETVRDL